MSILELKVTGLEMTGDIESQMVSIWSALNTEDTDHATPSLFTPWKKRKSKKRKERHRTHRKRGSSFHFRKHHSVEKK